MDMRAKLEEIIDECTKTGDLERRATAMNALTHLASYRSEVAKMVPTDIAWQRRQLALEARYTILISELGIPVKPPVPRLGAFDLEPA